MSKSSTNRQRTGVWLSVPAGRRRTSFREYRLQDKLDRTLASLHEAVLHDVHWPVAAGLIDDASAMKGNALVVGRGHSQDDSQILFARFCYRGGFGFCCGLPVP